ncbi:hypothetical protein V1264_017190 [Littorina saxatilis]|uniref:N-acetylgalactosaminide beta-1,3-galactosyltransferase n=1 Tax=Littorina saxatilis TaxID=31220 RepID=A0AAN9BGQ7_9CAEN
MTSSKIRLTSLQRRSVIFLFTGIVCGQLSCHFLISALRDRHFITCSFQELVIDTRGKISNFQTGVTSDSSIPKLLFVGVMTSRRYLRTRARAIHDTWGAAQNGSLLFFVGGNDDVDEKGLPVQILSDVIDSQYPPQRKSFAMLEFMHQKYGRKYEWFMRADDDVFVDVDRLRTMLASVDSSKPLYLGHPGTGKADEEGKLGLKVGAPYCMGGTGVILSRGALEALVAHKDECLRNTVSDHEDSELGRCVYNTTGVSCVKSEHVSE